MAAWTAVTRIEAEQNKFYGFGGWLIAFYAYAIVECILPMIGLFGQGRGLATMYGEDNLAMMRIVMAVNMVLPVPFLILAPLKHALMPVATIITFWISPILFLAAMTVGGVAVQTILIVVSLNAITAIAYTWYVLQSKRVNVTYQHRIPA